jgi:Na+-driven multidrug efflux pump
MIITPIVATFGTAVVAAYGVGMQVFSFGIMALVGIGLGLSSLIGHNVGSGKKQRARRTGDQAILMGVALLTFYGVIVFGGARFIMGLFFDTPETVEAGVTLLRIFSLGFPFFGAFIMLQQIFSGVGMNVPAMIVNTIQGWLLQTLPIVVMVEVFGLGQNVIWWVFAASGAVAAIGLYWYYRRERWLLVEV